ncbi:hemin uptake protein HemP [Pontibaca sp. S1109L]|uniref:Hemin uptake protein HemP n=2 Tax=Pontibaca salina TaxID=2795731 RepID=A0A934HUJ2_9RHOB|nr:hemin uptake protein HemP [Pontibaca salina]
MAATDRRLHADNPAPASRVPCHNARILTDGGDTAQIVLNDQIYTLRITRAGKLILTK